MPRLPKRLPSANYIHSSPENVVVLFHKELQKDKISGRLKHCSLSKYGHPVWEMMVSDNRTTSISSLLLFLYASCGILPMTPVVMYQLPHLLICASRYVVNFVASASFVKMVDFASLSRSRSAICLLDTCMALCRSALSWRIRWSTLSLSSSSRFRLFRPRSSRSSCSFSWISSNLHTETSMGTGSRK
jgi:hypothetical protein